jgi:uncharacterized protein YlxP (DUF503 family)
MYFRAEWVKSLKEKRSVIKPLIERAKRKFNVAVAEVEEMDNHTLLVIGFACVTNDSRLADEMVRNVAAYIENSTDAVLEDIIVEFF